MRDMSGDGEVKESFAVQILQFLDLDSESSAGKGHCVI